MDLHKMYPFEEVSYYGNSYYQYDDSNPDPHPTQTGRPVKVYLFFVVSIAQDDLQKNTYQPYKIVKIRVPRGIPIYRLRGYISCVESEMTSTYGACRRLGYLLMCPEDSDRWALEFTLPMAGVTFV